MADLGSSTNGSALDVAEILGPKNLPLVSVIPMTIFYSLIFVCGMVGNVSTCLVIANNQYMQTATNMYLFNLAVTDMLTLLAGIPTELYVLWQQYPWNLGNVVCHLKGLISETTANASILTIVAFTAERFLAICYPMRTSSRSKLVRASRVISLIWFVSIVSAVPFAVYQRVNFLYEHGGRRIQEASWCGISFADPDWKLLLLMPLSTLFFFVIPMALILVLYLNIALALRRSGSLRRCASSEAGNSCEAERSQVQCRRMVVRMLVAVVIVFFLCWAPFHAQRLLFTYGTVWDNWTSETLRTVNEWIFYVAGVLYYFNSAINPVLYNVMSKRFRVAFRENLCCRRRRRPARRASNKLLVVFRQSGSSERGGAGSLAELPPPPPPPEPPGVQLCCVQCRGAGSPRSRSEPAHARSHAELGCGGCSRHRHGLSKSEGNCPSSWSPVLASSEWRSSRARREPTELTTAAAAEDDWPPERVCVLLENGTHYQRVPLEASI